MKLNRSNTPSAEGQRQLEILRQAIRTTMEKKRCLGQYAVVWKNGKTVVIGKNSGNQVR